MKIVKCVYASPTLQATADPSCAGQAANPNILSICVCLCLLRLCDILQVLHLRDVTNTERLQVSNAMKDRHKTS